MRFPFRRKGRPSVPAKGYDQWSATYDTQPANAVLALESALFTQLLARVAIRGKTVLDVGCGTGRHWSEILGKQPERLFGVDASAGMLARLKTRFPDAEVIHCEGDHLPAIPNESVHVIVSSLALAHIQNAKRALEEWTRILSHGGEMLITDFHADAERAGMKRTFTAPSGTIEIEQHAVELNQLHALAESCGLEVRFTAERTIDESVRPLFEGDIAAQKYRQYHGLRLVFGVHFAKP